MTSMFATVRRASVRGITFVTSTMMLTSCATSTPPPPAPSDPHETTSPAVDAPGPTSTTTAFAISVDDVRKMVRAHRQHLEFSAWECVARDACEKPAPFVVDDHVQTFLRVDALPLDAARVQRLVARSVLDDARVPFPSRRAAAGPALRADVATILASVPAKHREARFHDAVRDTAASWDEFVSARASMDEVLAPAGMRAVDLIARRHGASVDEIREFLTLLLTLTESARPTTPPWDIPAILKSAAVAVDARRVLTGPLVQTRAPPAQAATPISACFLVDPPSDVRVVDGTFESPAQRLSARASRACAVAGGLFPDDGVLDPVLVDAVILLAFLTAPVVDGGELVRRQAVLLMMRGAATRAMIRFFVNHQNDADTRASVVGGTRARVSGAFTLMTPDMAGHDLDRVVSWMLAAAINERLQSALGVRWTEQATDVVHAELKRVLLDIDAARPFAVATNDVATLASKLLSPTP